MTTQQSRTLDHFELPPVPVVRYTVERYHRMLDDGYFIEDDRFELLEGWIVPKPRTTPPLAVSNGLAYDAFRALDLPGWHIRGQSSVTTAESEPEPDLAVVRGEARDYLRRHPGPGDMALVIEVADSSLGCDRGIKKRIYARTRVPAYWIVNLAERIVEVYTEPTGPGEAPTFASRRDFGPDEAEPVVIDGREVGRVVARELLP